MVWKNWMDVLSVFKYSVNMMPTVAAGTFSLNSAYFGIPCIANQKLDTQRICFPDLSVDVEDVYTARELARKLKNEPNFYKYVSSKATENYKKHYSIDAWKQHIYNFLNNI
jgi:hypothetical protein